MQNLNARVSIYGPHNLSESRTKLVSASPGTTKVARAQKWQFSEFWNSYLEYTNSCKSLVNPTMGVILSIVHKKKPNLKNLRKSMTIYENLRKNAKLYENV